MNNMYVHTHDGIPMFDECIYFNLTALSRKISRIWQLEFEKLGLSPSHGYLLFALAERDNSTQKELSELMELDASTITRFIDTLVGKGLLTRTAKGKGSTYSLTVEGKKSYRAIKKLMDDLYHTMQGHFGKQEFEHFVNDLHQARQSLTTLEKIP